MFAIDFDGINKAALGDAKSLLTDLIPGGVFGGPEYIVRNPRRNDQNPGSFSINYRTGIWKDFSSGDGGNDLISLVAFVHGIGQGEAARELAEKLGVAPYKPNGAGSSKANGSASHVAPEAELHTDGAEDNAIIISVPVDAPPAPDEHFELGKPTKTWTYTDVTGATIGYVYRFDPPERKKEFRPLTLHRIKGELEWRWEGWPLKRPLYGLHKLAERPSAKVCVVEGEKSADAAQKLLPDFVIVTSPNGSNAADTADWSPLRGRDVVIWPDADAPGEKYKSDVIDCLIGIGVKSVATVTPPGGVKEGWDAADAFEEGWTTERAAELIANALPGPSHAPDSSEGEPNDELTPSWENPDLSFLDDRRGDLPYFPLDVLSPDWQNWAKSAAHGAGTTVDHILVPLLGIASSLIGTARRARASSSWSEPLTMWTCVVGFSGTGKTSGLDVTKRALSKIERDRKHLIGERRREHEGRIERAKAAHKQWKARVQEAVEAGTPPPAMPADAEIPEPFVVPRLHISNSTIEKIAVLLQARPQGVVLICDELAGLFLNLARYSGGTDREFWLEAWNGKRYVVERMGRSAVDIDHLLVGMTGGFQPDKLARSFEGDADGIYARVCFSWPSEAGYQKLTNTVEEIEPEFENTLIRLIDLATFAEGRLIIRHVALTAEAITAFEQFREFVYLKKSGLDGREREWWAKTPAHVLRLAGTLAYLDWAREAASKTSANPEPSGIEARFVVGAVKLVTDYFGPHAQAALRQIGLTERHTKARKVLRWLRAERTPDSEVSIEDIRVGALGRTVDAEGTVELIDTLLRAGWFRKAQTQKTCRGRPARRWQINPLLWLPEIPEIPENGVAGGLGGISGISGISGKWDAAVSSNVGAGPISTDGAPPTPSMPGRGEPVMVRTGIDL
jgi:hypothetical protein